MTDQEEDIINRMYRLVGDRYVIIYKLTFVFSNYFFMIFGLGFWFGGIKFYLVISHQFIQGLLLRLQLVFS